MLLSAYGYATCLYVPIYLVGDACTEYAAILLVYVSFLACCSAHCLFEKHMFAFVVFDSCITNKGGVPNSFIQEEFFIRGEKL
jgi:hypothetical protein